MASDLKTSLTADTTLLQQQEQADASDVTTPIADLLALARSGRVGVSANATHIGHLIDVLTATSPVTLTENNDGGDETLAIALTAAMTALAANVNGSGELALAALNTGAALAGTPIVANGAGGATTGATGSSDPSDLTVTAGEALSERDFVVVRDDGKAYKWIAAPTNSSSYENTGLVRGVVTSTSIALNASGTMRVSGQVTGFSGLTAWEPVFVDDGTPGLITQTPPDITSQVRTDIVPVGYATDVDTIFVERSEITCVLRDSLLDNASIFLHHPTLSSLDTRIIQVEKDSGSLNVLLPITDISSGTGITVNFSSSTNRVTLLNRMGGTITLVVKLRIR